MVVLVGHFSAECFSSSYFVDGLDLVFFGIFIFRKITLSETFEKDIWGPYAMTRVHVFLV